MWSSIETKILEINRTIGIEIMILGDGSYCINSVTLRAKKKNIIREHSVTGIAYLEELPERLDKRFPLSVVLNGKGILTRKIPLSEVKNNPITTVLPNANPTQFYYEEFQNKHFHIISIIRKEIADTITNKLDALGFNVISVSLGISTLNDILKYLNPGNSKQVTTSNFTISLNGGTEILDYETRNDSDSSELQTEEYLVSNHYVKASHLLPFASSLCLLADDLKSPPRIPSDLVLKQRTEYRFKKIFIAGGATLLIAIFLTSLTSFLIFSHYFSLNKQASLSLIDYRQQQKQIQKINFDIKQKESFLRQSGWQKNGKASYYADRIASLTPPELLLTSMNIYPTKDNPIGEALAYKKDTVLVGGICEDPMILNQFINNLKIVSDFKEVNLKNYEYHRESENATFFLELTTK